ncbi:MAG: peptidase [Caulobacter sp.]|nr:peptidase [Caulobacter sp.]
MKRLALPLMILGAGLLAMAASAAPSPLSPAGRLAQLNLREQALMADLGQDRGRLSALLGGLMLFRRDPPPALLVSPGDARDAVEAAILIRAITPELQRRADALAAQGRALAALRRDSAAAQADVLTAESESADLRGSQPVDSSLGAVTAPLATAAPIQPMTALIPPVEGQVVRRFGDVTQGGERARGVSIRSTKGAMVKSPASGVVEYAGEVNGWGVVLILRTSGAYHLVLAGLEQSSALPGQSVAAGDTIGRLPDGGSSAPELYFEVREGGAAVDPAHWLAAAAHP